MLLVGVAEGPVSVSGTHANGSETDVDGNVDYLIDSQTTVNLGWLDEDLSGGLAINDNVHRANGVGGVETSGTEKQLVSNGTSLGVNGIGIEGTVSRPGRHVFSERSHEITPDDRSES